jgi:hypothetical protein
MASMIDGWTRRSKGGSKGTKPSSSAASAATHNKL